MTFEFDQKIIDALAERCSMGARNITITMQAFDVTGSGGDWRCNCAKISAMEVVQADAPRLRDRPTDDQND